MLWRLMIALLVGISVAPVASAASSVLECVGYTEFTLPSAAQVADVPVESLLAQIRMATPQPLTAYPDGTPAGYSTFNPAGELLVTRIGAGDWNRLYSEVEKNVAKERAWSATHRTESDGSRRNVEIFGPKDRSLIGWRVNASFHVLFKQGDLALKWTTWDDEGDVDRQIAFGESLLEAIKLTRPRADNTSPHQPGTCLPHVLVPLSGVLSRHVAVSFRLIDHPDVTVWISDSAPGPTARLAPSEVPSTKADNNRFWTQNFQDRKKVRLLGFGLRKVSLAGMDGEASFVELTRDDDSVDFGYFASAHGDPAYAQSTDLQMFVIRDSRVARKMGVTPVSKDDLLAMAERIAASVHRRPEN